MTRRSQTLRASLGLSAFLVVAVAVTVVIAATIRPVAPGGTVDYRALFSNASHLTPGDDVRVAGVPIGKVKSVELTHDGRALVKFGVVGSLSLTTGTHAAVRYLNLIGDRYLSLSNGPGSPLRPGTTLPLDHTQPALDLSELFNGFKPLFAALSPADVNKLAASIISILQGEGGTVSDLLRQTADVTNSLADRDGVIGRVITNLDALLSTVDHRQTQLAELVDQLDRFMTGLAGDRRAIVASLSHIDTMTSVTASLLRDARPSLKADIDHLGQVATSLNSPDNSSMLERIIETTPTKLDRISRAASYGSWFNFYLCGLNVRLLPDSTLLSLLDPLFSQVRDIQLQDSSPRCAP
jgi:phospholipid/cholesterol/gamma-HCH transport system substrate-binding protein